MKKSIGLYKLENKIFIHSKKGTQSVAAFSEPLFELNMKDTPQLIGEKVRECMEAYQTGNERYDREKWKAVNDPLLKLANEKNSRHFFEHVLNPQVLLINDLIYFCPRVNHGFKDGFKNTVYANIELDYSVATDEDLGNAVLKSLELSSFAEDDRNLA